MKKIKIIIMLVLAVVIITGCSITKKDLIDETMPELALGNHLLIEEAYSEEEVIYKFTFEIINTGAKGRLRIETDFKTFTEMKPIVGEIESGIIIPMKIWVVSQPLDGVNLKVYAISSDGEKEELQIDAFIEKQ